MYGSGTPEPISPPQAHVLEQRKIAGGHKALPVDS
jgi:hypothetical protein